MLGIRLSRRSLLLTACAGAIAACGGGEAAEPESTTPPSTDEQAETPTTSAPASPVSRGEAQAEGSTRDILRVASNEDLVDLHIGNLTIAGDRVIVENIYSRLVRFKPGSLAEVEPELAEEWEVAPDGMMYTFRLRQGVQFHQDYGELTAEDVKATFEYHMDPDGASREKPQYNLVDRVETPDSYTVEVYMKEVYVPFVLATLAWQSGCITSARALEEIGDQLSFQPVGSGPYYLDSWQQGQQITLKAHESYFRGAPAIKTVEIKVIPEDQVAILAMDQGEIDLIAVRQIGAYRELQQRSELTVYQAESGWNYWAYFQTQKPPTDNLMVRQALAHAVDLDAIEASLNGLVTVNPSYFNPLVVGWTDDLPVYDYDPDRAKQMLADAGFANPADVTIRIAYSKAHLYEEMALLLQDFWNQVGVNAQVELIDRALFGQVMQEGDWNVGVWAVTRLESDLYAYPFTHSEGTSNYSQWSNPEADRLIEAARTETDPDQRAQIYADLQALVKQELPIHNTGTMQSIIVTRPDVKGVIPHPYVGLVDFSLVYIE